MSKRCNDGHHESPMNDEQASDMAGAEICGYAATVCGGYVIYGLLDKVFSLSSSECRHITTLSLKEDYGISITPHDMWPYEEWVYETPDGLIHGEGNKWDYEQAVRAAVLHVRKESGRWVK